MAVDVVLVAARENDDSSSVWCIDFTLHWSSVWVSVCLWPL